MYGSTTDLKFDKRGVDLSEFGYNDKSYIASPADLRPGQSLMEWIAQIFPMEEPKADDANANAKAGLKRASSFRNSEMSMDFLDNPMNTGRGSRMSVY